MTHAFRACGRRYPGRGGTIVAKTVGLIGVPTSMGAFAPGQEKGPQALRDADLPGRLSRAGAEVEDHGDAVRVRRWRPDKGNRRAQNAPAVAEVARETAARVRDAAEAGRLPFVAGGDCTIELGTVAGLLPSGGRLGLIYFDLHPDLNVPESIKEGTLDWMGVAHMLGEEGAAEQLRASASRLATFRTWRRSVRLNRCSLTDCYIRYSPTGGAS